MMFILLSQPEVFVFIAVIRLSIQTSNQIIITVGRSNLGNLLGSSMQLVFS